MVRGEAIAVTAVALTYQCADTARIARGFGADAPKPRQASVKRLRSSAFIGLPWPRNAAGIVRTAGMCILRSMIASHSSNWLAPQAPRTVQRTVARRRRNCRCRWRSLRGNGYDRPDPPG